MPSSCQHATITCKSSINCQTATSRNLTTNINDCPKYPRLAQQLRAVQQVGPVEIQGTFYEAVNPQFPTFRSKYMTIAELIKKLTNLQHYTILPNQIKQCMQISLCQVKKAIFMTLNLQRHVTIPKGLSRINSNTDMFNMIYYEQSKIYACMDTIYNDM